MTVSLARGAGLHIVVRFRQNRLDRESGRLVILNAVSLLAMPARGVDATRDTTELGKVPVIGRGILVPRSWGAGCKISANSVR